MKDVAGYMRIEPWGDAATGLGLAVDTTVREHVRNHEVEGTGGELRWNTRASLLAQLRDDLEREARQ